MLQNVQMQDQIAQQLYYGQIIAGLLILTSLQVWEMFKQPRLQWSDRMDFRNPLYINHKLFFMNHKKQQALRTKRAFKGNLMLFIWLLAFEIYERIYIPYAEHAIFFVDVLFLLWFYLTLIFAVVIVPYRDWKEFSSAYRYTEKKGIWFPFRYICRPRLFISVKGHKGFQRKYKKYENYDGLKKEFLNIYQSQGYGELRTYFLGSGEEISFCYKEQKNFLEIFSLSYVKLIRWKELECFNKYFSEYWNECLQEKKKMKEIRMIYLMSAEAESNWTQEMSVKEHAVDQEIGRYRLPIVMIFGKNPELRIYPIFSKRRGFLQYSEMQHDLCQFMGINMKNK